MKRKYLSFILLMSMVWSLVMPGLSGNSVQAAEQEALGYVTVSVEKFTLGQGYYREPAKVPYYEGENGADVLLRVLGEGNARYGGAVNEGFYLTAVKDMNAGQPVIPPYILDHAGDIGSRIDGDWLAQLDYTDMSGWWYIVNHSSPNYGMSQYAPQDGDVMRVQFSVHGWGADLGFGYPTSYIEAADKDELTAKLAEINSSPDQAELLADPVIRAAYDEAYAVAADMEIAQESVGSALAKLSAALAGRPDRLRDQHLQDSLAYLVRTISNPTYNHSEWAILSLARAGYEVPAGYYDLYYSNLEARVAELMTTHGGRLDRNRGTEHSRLIIGLTALGRDITDVADYDLRQALADFTFLNRQGINGPIFGLIGLNTQHYTIPELQGTGDQTTRAKMVATILNREIARGTEAAGGWALGNSAPDPDITSMAIQALTPYYGQDSEVKAAVDRGLAWLSAAQQPDGGYASWGANNAESAAQVIVAATGLGIDPHTDPRFVKNGKSVIDALMSFGFPGGGFKHLREQSRADSMASDQGTYALVAYDRFLNGQNSLYDMTDVQSEAPGEQPQMEWPIPGGAQPSIDIPTDERSYRIAVTSEDKDKQIVISIPEQRRGTVQLQLPDGELPRIEAVQGNTVIVLPQGSEVYSGDASSVKLFGPSAVTALQVAAQLEQGAEVEQIVRQFSLGGYTRIGFSDFVTLTFTGLAGHGAAFAEQGAVTLIPHYDSKTAGEASGEDVFSYVSGEDLIVMTKHFTDFVVYRQKASQPPGGGDGGGPGPPPVTSTVTIAVDKDTINKGYVVTPVSVPLQSGDTVWTVLQRTLDARNISYEYSWSGEYGSVYVESIAGDGEFDHGPGSGWMYNVNGTYPNVGASAYVPQNGDSIRWRYTTNLGADLGAPPPGEDTGSGGSGGSGGGGAAGGGTTDRTPEIVVPSSLTADYTVKLADKDKQTDHITIRVPQSPHAILLDLQAVASAIPQVSAIRGDLTLHIAKGTKLTSGGPAIRLLNAIDADASDLEAAIAAEEGESAEVRHAFTLASGTNKAVFDQPLTITIKGGAGLRVAYNTADSWEQVPAYANEQAATVAQTQQIYAYTSGQNLIIRTKTAASFLTYTSDTEEEQPETGPTYPTDPNAAYLDRSSIAGWAYDGIARATGLGWLQGSEGNFRPQADITRAEFTKLLTELMGLNTLAPAQSVFTDVRADQWFHPYVQSAYEAGLVNGYGERFEPQATITREQMAVMIARALDLPAQPDVADVADAAQIAEWARSEVAAVYAAGLMTGDAGRFHPQRQVSREMAAVVAVRAYDILERGIPAAPTPPARPAPEPEQPTPDAALPQVQRTIADAAGYLQRTVTSPAVASVGGEWSVFGLARSQIDVPAAYYERYLTNLEETLKAADGVLHRVKYTEYDRVILALTALGKPVDDVAGYNMLQPLADYDTLIKQGINGPIFALIALDSKGYTIPAHTGSGTQTSRQQLVDFILNREIRGGGWALDSQATDPDPDLTAMAIQALTPYYAQQDRVKAAVDRAVAWLSQAQAADGGYLSWGASNAESAAQVVVALTGLGIDPHTDPRFIKNGSSALDALLGFAVAGSGFYHILPGGADNGGAKPGEVDVMATDQALYALVAYERYATGKSRLYDLTDAN